MKLGWPVQIAGTGLGLPGRTVTNAEFERRLDTSHEWILQRTGICERRFAEPHESTLSLATAAARAALSDAQLGPDQIDLIICATITPDHLLPSTACELQAALGCRQIPAYDMAAACSGFVWGLILAAQHIVTGTARNVLLIGAETLSRITDMEDRATAVLFGDGAAAVVVQPSTDPQRQILAVQLGADGSRGMLIHVPAGGSKLAASFETVASRAHYMKMQGREVYKFAVTKMQEVMQQTAEEAGVLLDDVALIVPHQSNLRIIESACEKAGVPLGKVVVNIDRYGNTSAASVPIALHEARCDGRLRRGDLVMLVAFGAGLTWGSVLLRY
jgi:3-oxoacyl-[acyl-carrier-protein] synthase-3